MNGHGDRWSVGELAGACGVTVRTLHHYDQIGLLRAGTRTASGHRRYTRHDVQRLYRIRELLSRIESAVMPSTEQFMSTLEMIAVLENHFTPKQRQELADRRAELGADRIEAAKLRWAALVEEGLRHVEAATPVSDPSVRQWAQSWDELGSMFHSGEQTKSAARALWQDNSAALSAGLPWSPDKLAGLLAYLEEVRQLPPAKTGPSR